MKSKIKKSLCIVIFLFFLVSLLMVFQPKVVFSKARFSFEGISGEGTTNYGLDIDDSYGIDYLRKGVDDTFLNYYFTNLDYNIGYNPDYSCVYVATGMLLSYFDTWWNDDIICEEEDSATILGNNAISYLNYPVQSPGVNSDYLIGKGPVGGPAGAGSELSARNLNEKLNFESIQGGDVLEFIISYLDMGYPVLVELKYFGQEVGHAVVAFAYESDEEGNTTLFMHNGYKSNDSRGYSRIITLGANHQNQTPLYTATVFYPIVEHKCSDNYVYTDENGNKTYHCPCELEGHPAHLRKYTHSYAHTESGHTEICSYNGTVKTGPHVLDYAGSYDDEAHTKGCVCGYTTTESHALSYSGSYGEDRHTVYCECGYEAEREHEYSAYSLNGGWHCVYCPCFGEENEPHYPYYTEILIDGRRYRKCEMCGYSERI